MVSLSVVLGEIPPGLPLEILNGWYSFVVDFVVESGHELEEENFGLSRRITASMSSIAVLLMYFMINSFFYLTLTLS
jgi:hypothetical protein